MATLQLNTVPGHFVGFVVPGDGADFTATRTDADWPAGTVMVVETAAGAESTLLPTLVEGVAAWTLTAAQVTALIGTRTTGQLRARITTGEADLRRGEIAGTITILSKWTGVPGVQALGTVTLTDPIRILTLDGGAASTTYLTDQSIDGGAA